MRVNPTVYMFGFRFELGCYNESSATWYSSAENEYRLDRDGGVRQILRGDDVQKAELKAICTARHQVVNATWKAGADG